MFEDPRWLLGEGGLVHGFLCGAGVRCFSKRMRGAARHLGEAKGGGRSDFFRDDKGATVFAGEKMVGVGVADEFLRGWIKL